MKFSNLYRLYTNQPIIGNKNLTLDSDKTHYLKNVLRMQIGNEFRIFNETDGEFIATIIDITKHSLSVQVVENLRKPQINQQLTLGLCLIKIDKMLDAIDLAVQLGVTAIAPLISTRSQMRHINYDRLLKRIIESVEQSERLDIPKLFQVMQLNEFQKQCSSDIIIYANEDEEESATMRSINLKQDNISLIVGPEGGFTKEELSTLATWKNSYSVSLSKNVLRSETAVATGLSQIQLLLQ